MKRKETFVVFLIFVFLIAFLFATGVYNYGIRVAGKKIGENKASEIKQVEVMVNGSPVQINTRTYEESEGYKVDYDIDNFDYKYVNDELRFVLKKDQSIYVGIKKVLEKGIETSDTKFISKNGLILRIRTISENNQDNLIDEILKHMVNSIEIVK